MRIHIKGGRLVDPANKLDAKQDLFISDGVIAGIDKKPDGFESDLEINAKDKLVLPGLVDICARFREPGFENKVHSKRKVLPQQVAVSRPFVVHQTLTQLLIQQLLLNLLSIVPEKQVEPKFIL